MSDDLQAFLQDYCAAAFSGWQAPRAGDPAWLNAGWESDIYAFTLEHGPADARRRTPLVLRVYPGEDTADDAAREFKALQLLGRAGYPVPQAYVLECDHSPIGRPFLIMEKIEGQILWPLLFHGPEQNREQLLALFCDLLHRLHSLDWTPFAPDWERDRDPYLFVDGLLAQFQDQYRRIPKPDFLPVFAWLDARRDLVPCHRPGVIHWDFHPANVLVRADGSAVVIDWTQATVSDTRFDLGWTLLLIGSAEGLAWRERVLHEYERLAAAPVQQLAYFEVIAALKRLYSFAVSLSHGAQTLGMRPGAEEAMKAQAGSLSHAYDMLRARTGIRIEELERLFDQLMNSN